MDSLAAIRITVCLPRPRRGGELEFAGTDHRCGLLDIALAEAMRDGLLGVSGLPKWTARAPG